MTRLEIQKLDSFIQIEMNHIQAVESRVSKGQAKDLSSQLGWSISNRLPRTSLIKKSFINHERFKPKHHERGNQVKKYSKLIYFKINKCLKYQELYLSLELFQLILFGFLLQCHNCGIRRIIYQKGRLVEYFNFRNQSIIRISTGKPKNDEDPSSSLDFCCSFFQSSSSLSFSIECWN